VTRPVPRRVIGLRAGTPVPEILVVDDQVEKPRMADEVAGLHWVFRSGRGGRRGSYPVLDGVEPAVDPDGCAYAVMDGLEATRE